MPNIAAIFKQEIARLSRKEIRQQTKPLRRAVTQYRRDIAKLKREASKLQNELGRLTRQTGNGGAPPPRSEGNGERARFTAKGVRSHRARLGVSAANFGKLIGVTGHTVYKWEHGSAKPRKQQLAGLAALRTIGKKDAAARLEKLVAKQSSAKAARTRRARVKRAPRK